MVEGKGDTKGGKADFFGFESQKNPKIPKNSIKSQKILENPKNPKKSQKILENPKKFHKIRKCKIESGFQQYSPIIFSSASNINKQC